MARKTEVMPEEYENVLARTPVETPSGPVPQPYPAVRYHADGSYCTVVDEADQKVRDLDGYTYATPQGGQGVGPTDK